MKTIFLKNSFLKFPKKLFNFFIQLTIIAKINLIQPLIYRQKLLLIVNRLMLNFAYCPTFSRFSEWLKIEVFSKPYYL